MKEQCIFCKRPAEYVIVCQFKSKCPDNQCDTRMYRVCTDHWVKEEELFKASDKYKGFMSLKIVRSSGLKMITNTFVK
jgi:hypothetical protein